MFFNKLLLSLMLLSVSFNIFSQLENKESQECQECALNDLFTLDGLLSNPEVKEFYDSLSENEKEDFIALVKELNIVSTDILTKLVEVLQKYEGLVVKYNDTNKSEKLKMVIAFASTDLDKFEKELENSSYKDFINNLTVDEKSDFENFCKEMQSCFKCGTVALSDLFNKFSDLKSKYKEVTKRNIVLVVGCDEDDALPCDYLII